MILKRCFLGLLEVRVQGARVRLCQSRHLVNVKLKWVKDRELDAVVSREGDLRAACILISLLSSDPHRCVPIYHLLRQRRQLGLPEDVKVSTFLRRYPTLFYESHFDGGAGGTTPCFGLTDEALTTHQDELDILLENEVELVRRLQKLLMLTCNRILPLQTIEQLKWDMGLPYDYQHSLIPRHSQLFLFVRLPDDRIGLKLRCWDSELAISELQKNGEGQGVDRLSLSFPIGFTRGFGLKRKCMEWLDEWQRLPYTCPYADPSHLDPRTDVAEKRIVGVFHELLNLTIQKKTARKNVSNLRTPLGLPQKFTKVFGRHPGIFYISQKCATQTVILREAYSRQELLDKYKHPLLEIRKKYINMMKTGLLNRSKGLYKKTITSSVTDSVSDSDGEHHELLVQDDILSSGEEHFY